MYLAKRKDILLEIEVAIKGYIETWKSPDICGEKKQHQNKKIITNLVDMCSVIYSP